MQNPSLGSEGLDSKISAYYLGHFNWVPQRQAKETLTKGVVFNVNLYSKWQSGSVKDYGSHGFSPEVGAGRESWGDEGHEDDTVSAPKELDKS